MSLNTDTRISSRHLLLGVVLFSFVGVVVMYFITTLLPQPRHRVNTNHPAIAVRSYYVSSHPVETKHVISYPVKNNSFASFPVHTNSMTSYPVQTNPMTSYPVTLRVLYYNKPEWISDEVFNNCEYRCKMISGSKEISSAKFVIFHGPRIRQKLPPKKSRGQLWILNGMESPVNYHTDLSNWSNVFNWTFTFRRDSDVLFFNFRFQNIPENKTASDDWKTKDRQAVWMVSNCRTYSKREEYVKQLQNFTTVHVYGECGTHNCSRSKENTCMEILQNRYQYYLAYENSLCMDYVTEKGFKTYTYSPSTIPVMRGGSNYSLYFPPGSYINTKDFESAQTLGKTMHSKLMSEGQLDTYFSWTQSYSVDYTFRHDSWCALCKSMHHAENHERLYSNIKHWLFDNPRQGCKSPTDL
ncbi:alpha-(1,3)-fucosyltransferase C-like isoform X1 [Argopecten irradians]|uniref:alpha-(1,3)-fucosyltransferase C-like isoform X1 n=1 Tax=Argopecten irradians TaxID=31199 RepID=UPI003710599D